MTETFTRLLPDARPGSRRPTSPRRAQASAAGDRPFLLVNMIATADGRATIAGRAGPIANRADYELFHALRTRVDAVLVGAETVRVESYGPMEPAAVLVTRSRERPAPRSACCGRPATGSSCSPLRRTRELPPCRRAREYLRDRIASGVRRLRTELGIRSVLCEGGPHLLGDAAAGAAWSTSCTW